MFIGFICDEPTTQIYLPYVLSIVFVINMVTHWMSGVGCRSMGFSHHRWSSDAWRQRCPSGRRRRRSGATPGPTAQGWRPVRAAMARTVPFVRMPTTTTTSVHHPSLSLPVRLSRLPMPASLPLYDRLCLSIDLSWDMGISDHMLLRTLHVDTCMHVYCYLQSMRSRCTRGCCAPPSSASPPPTSGSHSRRARSKRLSPSARAQVAERQRHVAAAAVEGLDAREGTGQPKCARSKTPRRPPARLGLQGSPLI